MKNKQQKSQELKNLENKIPRASIVIFTTFSRAGEKGLSVVQMRELRRLLRGIGSEYFVTKKTLMDRAINVKNKNYDGVDIFEMAGSAGLVLGNGDAHNVARRIYEFAKKNQALKFEGAIFENKFIDAVKFKEMALIPPREMLVARLLGMMKYPLSSLTICLRQIADRKTN